MSDIHFYGLDGDKIGAQIELHIINQNFSSLAHFSRAVSDVLETIKDDIIAHGGSVLLCAGDSIFFSGEHAVFNDAWCKQTLETFMLATGCSLSIGRGKSGSAAYLALKLAKAMGGNRSIIFPMNE